MSDQSQPPHDPIRNRNKRRQAWTCLICFVATFTPLIIAGLLSADMAARISEMSHLITLWGGGLVSVVLAYMGASVAATWIAGKK